MISVRPRPRWMISVAALAGALSACGGDKQAAPAAGSGSAAPVKVIGIYPDKWTCDLVATDQQVGEALGGEARAIEGALQTPRDLAKPCNYAVTVGGTVEPWTFDVDCRDNYADTATALFAEYERTSADLVAAYNGASDAGPLPTVDGGPPTKAPEASHPVEVGKRGLDHHGQAILFVDDDAPCYVRVVGPDAARRLALAKVVARGLTAARAPMVPRQAP